MSSMKVSAQTCYIRPSQCDVAMTGRPAITVITDRAVPAGDQALRLFCHQQQHFIGGKICQSTAQGAQNVTTILTL